MKKILNRNLIIEYIPVFVIAVVASILSIVHVIIGYARTPPGLVYLATGHYYLDYYEYVQAISQGIRGRWLPVNYFTLESIGIELRYWPYTIIGRFFSIFHLSAFSAYWASVIVFIIVLIVLIYIAITRILKDKPNKLRIFALLITVLSCYFYKVVKVENGLKIIPFNLWYSPDNFFARFNVVPYHLLATILILLIILKVPDLFEDLHNLSKLKVIIKSLLIAVLTGLVLSFQPFSLITFFVSLAVFCSYWMVRAILEKKTKNLSKIIIFASVVLIISLLAAIFVKSSVGATAVGKGLVSFELNFIQQPSLMLLFLSLGPAFVLSFFGLRTYLKDKNPLRIFILIFAISSYVLYMSSADKLIGTHNGRFLSPLSYILFGSLAALGIEQVTSFFKSKRELIFISLSFILFLYFIAPIFSGINGKLKSNDLFSPISYLPAKVIDGFKALEKEKSEDAVLTYPHFFLGTILPIFADKKVFLGRSPQTPDWTNKAKLTDEFYLGQMSDDEAKSFITKNRIGFVIITSIEGLSWPKLNNYLFLKEIYKNSDIVVFKVVVPEQI